MASLSVRVSHASRRKETGEFVAGEGAAAILPRPSPKMRDLAALCTKENRPEQRLRRGAKKDLCEARCDEPPYRGVLGIYGVAPWKYWALRGAIRPVAWWGCIYEAWRSNTRHEALSLVYRSDGLQEVWASTSLGDKAQCARLAAGKDVIVLVVLGQHQNLGPCALSDPFGGL